jgi:membrane protease YdiL (CAAX protease family)
MSIHEIAVKNKKIEQHSLVKSLLLHLMPGFVISMIYVILVPFMNKLGVPPFLVLMILVLVLLIPFELGYLFYQAKKKNGSFSLEGIVVFRQAIPTWQVIVITLLLLVWGYFALLIVFRPLEKPIIDTFFTWVPDVYFFETFINHLDQYAKSVLGILLNGFFGPIVEELYFRGFLLPRISRFGLWAPLLHTVLFALYHFFTPWQILLRILAFLPISYSVWWKKNIYLGMIVHCLMNLIGSIMMLVIILNLG